MKPTQEAIHDALYSRTLGDPGPQPPPDYFEVNVKIRLTKNSNVTKTIEVYSTGRAQSDVLKEAVEAALAELKGKP